MWRRILAGVFLAASSLIAVPVSGATGAEDHAAPEFCIALRGNGYKVPVTLAALARLTEEFGVADVVLGSSSGSIAAFLHESILHNPAIRDCGPRPCSDREMALRVSLAIKSMLGFSDYLRTTAAGRRVERIATRLETNGRPGMRDLLSVLTDPQLRAMINGRALFPSIAVLNPLNWRTQARRLGHSASAVNFGSTVSFEHLLREGLLDLDHMLVLIGRAADFYSGSGPDLAASWRTFYQQCADDHRGAGWPSIARRETSAGATCGAHFLNTIRQFNAQAYPPQTRVRRIAGRRTLTRQRRIEPLSLERAVGATHPTLATVSFVLGAAPFEEFESAKRRYDRFQDVDLSPRRWQDRFRVAYFGPSALLDRIARNPAGYEDLKTRRFHAAGGENWREVMLRSIGEPGLQAARGYRTPNGEAGVTMGGWVDNFGTPALKNLGCGAVAYVTRRGTDSIFASAVARQLGADDTFVRNLFSATAEGSLGVALEAADSIVCTDWDSFAGPLNSPLEMAIHGYESPLVTRSEWFLDRASRHLPVSTDHGVPGCRPPP